MGPRHAPAVVLVPLTLVASLLSLGTGAASAAPPAAGQPSAGRPTAGTARPAAGLSPRSATVGRPARNYVIPRTSYFSYPTGSYAAKVQIRNRVLYTVQSVWGGPRTSLGTPRASNGKIRMATWSFNDMTMARALLAARNRGVSVQIVAAASANTDSKPWKYLQRHLGARLYRPGHPETRDTYSFARQCRGSCRGSGGTPHSKFFLFDNVGSRHLHDIVVQTSMNLTSFAVNGQWNQAQAMKSARIADNFRGIFRQMRLGRRVANPYNVRNFGSVVDYFFPLPGASSSRDPVMQTLSRVSCHGATSGGTGSRTRIRVIQYAIYDNRGVWISKKLRYLWNRGCDVAIIYALSSKPVLNILRSRSGRGPVPMRQSITKNRRGEIAKYNHSKWMTITGHWGSSTRAAIVFTGSSNWANLAFGSDEQMQRISSPAQARRYQSVFAQTWRQRTSRKPSYGSLSMAGRALPADVPAVRPAFGQGVYRYMTPD
jgi:hypothetical protein